MVKGKDDVPYTKETASDRVNKYTGKPYSDNFARLGLNFGGKVAQQIAKTITRKPKDIKAFHGTASDFDKFSTEFLKTGEGINAFGKGLYFTETEEVAKSYKKQLSKNKEIFALGEEKNKILNKASLGLMKNNMKESERQSLLIKVR